MDSHPTIHIKESLAKIDVDIHDSFVPAEAGSATVLTRRLVLDFAMPLLRPLRPVIARSFDRKNLRTMAAAKPTHRRTCAGNSHPTTSMPNITAESLSARRSINTDPL
jgi:hypothetical protein